jgi:hypothetical protein
MSKYSEQLLCPNCGENLFLYTDAWKCPTSNCNFIIYRKRKEKEDE